MAERLVIRRELAARREGALGILDALRWPVPLGSAVRIWMARGVTAAQAGPGQGGEVRLRAGQMAGANLVLSGTAAAGQGALRAEFAACGIGLEPSVPETALFAGMNVICGQRHVEPAGIAADWLRYHVAEHGADAALIVDRAPPGEDRAAFAASLEEVAAGIAGLRRLLIVTAPVPLGRAGQPALGDPASAPRLRGQTPEADPWRAPLGEPVLYDILKWRFLARAAAVAALDLCDLLAEPDDDIALFDAARLSHGGVLPLAGEAVYPWRIRKGRAPEFGDHICRAEPPVTVPRRWVVAPARCGPDNIWLPGMVAGLRAPADEGAAFHRCMSVLFPRSRVQDLVQKPQLFEDAGLAERAADMFDAAPVRPPAAPAPAPRPLAAAPSGRTVIVTCMKNEGPFILEWLAWHRMIGVDDVLIYTNDCTDGTDALLDLLQARGLVQRRDNPFRERGLKPQHAALGAAASEAIVRRAGWILPIDVDEFVTIHAGAGRLADLYAAVPDANAVSMTWRLFGNADIDAFEDRFVTEQFTRCAPQLIRRPHQAWGFKTLYRNLGLFTEMGVHRPKGLAPGMSDAVNWVNGSGRPMPRGFLQGGWRSGIDSYGYDLVTLNHYAVRSAESFLVKRDRGRVNHTARDQGEAYWFRMNNNAEQDRSAQRHLPELRRAVAALMADPEIAAAHAACVAAHRARIAELHKDADHAALYASLTSDRMKRLSRMHRHFGMNVFLNGPSVIPDRVMATDLPADFFFNTGPPEGRAAD